MISIFYINYFNSKHIPMIKTCFSYFIYDFCIDVIFEKLRENFALEVYNKMPKTGDFYVRISHKSDDEHYHNCIIKRVEKRKNINNLSYYIVYLEYEYSSGSLFDDEDEEDFDNENDNYDRDEDFEEDITDDVDVDYSKWYDSNKIEALDLGDVLSVNYSYYTFYK